MWSPHGQLPDYSKVIRARLPHIASLACLCLLPCHLGAHSFHFSKFSNITRLLCATRSVAAAIIFKPLTLAYTKPKQTSPHLLKKKLLHPVLHHVPSEALAWLEPLSFKVWKDMHQYSSLSPDGGMSFPWLPELLSHWLPSAKTTSSPSTWINTYGSSWKQKWTRFLFFKMVWKQQKNPKASHHTVDYQSCRL